MSAAAVSVCIPAYQAGRYIAGTVSSVLSQTFEDFELVVLDNASTDATPEILRGFTDPRVRVLRNERVLPLAENWNRVVAESRGRYVKLLCADDLLHPDCLRRQYEVLAADRGIALVCARRDMISETGAVLAANKGLRGLVGRHEPDAVIRKVVRHGGNPLGEPGGALFRREQFDAVGGWDRGWKFPMDLALWIRLLGHGDFYGQPESLAAFRIAPGSLSAVARRAEYDEQRALSEDLASDPVWGVRPVDRLVGAAMAPWARLRRVALFLVARSQGARS
ncbi:glycosyltransferase [Amycolatopsis granulosa]|uniref:glycosyltransferase n=1 Tax=Amycolatopsis granulosa TaxID=185684 RepID=UPI0014237755|nr:glycosyltransferase involved in cell wall biosynthesis [Amycolatopsis granulosa]